MITPPIFFFEGPCCLSIFRTVKIAEAYLEPESIESDADINRCFDSKACPIELLVRDNEKKKGWFSRGRRGVVVLARAPGTKPNEEEFRHYLLSTLAPYLSLDPTTYTFTELMMKAIETHGLDI